MKSLVKSKREQGIWMEDSPIPTIGANDVLIKIRKTAICGTDVHIYKWNDWAQEIIPVPMIIGHEYVGEIAEVGKEVTAFKVGDRVSGEGHIPCNQCMNCRSGKAHLCIRNIGVGVTRQGCFAEYLSLPACNAYPIPDDITDDQGAILDPYGNATHVALSFDLVGKDVLITGAGPIGIMAAAIAKHVGARHIVLTDINQYRIELAKKLNVENAINVTNTSVESVREKLGIDEGFSVAFEMSGSPQAFQSVLDNINHAGKIAMLGFLPPTATVDWNKIILKGIIIKGIYGREIFETWQKMIAMLQSGLNIDPIITHHFKVDDYQEAFDVMSSGNSGKVILDWT